jgi:MoaA/NifB/PqqE/SkfB family radical SAM enzyme
LGCYHALCLVRGDSKNRQARQVDLDKYRAICDHLERVETQRAHRFPFSLTGKLIDQVIKDIVIRTSKEKRMLLPCLSGKRSIVIQQDGEVHPCELLDRGYGNIRDYNYDIDAVLSTPTAKEINQFIKDRKCYCTFECTLPLGIIYSPRGLYWLFRKYVNYLLLRVLRLAGVSPERRSVDSRNSGA